MKKKFPRLLSNKVRQVPAAAAYLQDIAISPCLHTLGLIVQQNLQTTTTLGDKPFVWPFLRGWPLFGGQKMW